MFGAKSGKESKGNRVRQYPTSPGGIEKRWRVALYLSWLKIHKKKKRRKDSRVL